MGQPNFAARTDGCHICGDAAGRPVSAAVPGLRAGTSIVRGRKHSCQHRPVLLQLDSSEDSSILKVRTRTHHLLYIYIKRLL